MWRRALKTLSSIKLTVGCLAASMVLVLAGTLAQVHLGTHEVQERYFQSLIVWWPADPHAFHYPVYPGGHLLGGLLLLNLIAAHITRFQWTWRKLGMQLIHVGLIVMLAGGLFTDLFSVESHMHLAVGETRSFSEDFQLRELAVIDTSDSQFDQVTAIPEARLREGGSIEEPSLPFRIIVRRFFPNSQLAMLGQGTAPMAPATDHGFGTRVSITERPHETAEDRHDIESAVIEMVPVSDAGGSGERTLGTWLVSEGFGGPQTFSFAGKTWRIALRAARYYKPYSLTLQKFTHEIYAGTEIAKNYASSVKLDDPDRSEHRDVLIYMNHPLRYRGDTFYQSGFEQGDKVSIFQVVHNPSFVAPYIACAIVGAGLLIQFSYHFVAFSRLRRTTPAS